MATLEEQVAGLPPHLRHAVEVAVENLIDTDRAMEAAPAGLAGLGPRRSRQHILEAAARNEARVWAARRRVYETGWTRQRAADRLGVGTDQIAELISAGDLLTLDGPDGERLPAWQFHPEAPRGLLDGIHRVAVVFPGRVLGLSSWMTAPNSSLDGRTPSQALAHGDVEQVVAVAEYLGA